MKTLFLSIAFFAFSLPALCQTTLNIVFTGDTTEEVMRAVGKEFRALDGVDVVINLDDALLVVSVDYRKLDELLVASLAVMYADNNGQLVYLAHGLQVSEDAEALAKDLASFVDEKVLVNLN